MIRHTSPVTFEALPDLRYHGIDIYPDTDANEPSSMHQPSGLKSPFLAATTTHGSLEFYTYDLPWSFYQSSSTLSGGPSTSIGPRNIRSSVAHAASSTPILGSTILLSPSQSRWPPASSHSLNSFNLDCNYSDNSDHCGSFNSARAVNWHNLRMIDQYHSETETSVNHTSSSVGSSDTEMIKINNPNSYINNPHIDPCGPRYSIFRPVIIPEQQTPRPVISTSVNRPPYVQAGLFPASLPQSRSQSHSQFRPIRSQFTQSDSGYYTGHHPYMATTMPVMPVVGANVSASGSNEGAIPRAGVDFDRESASPPIPPFSPPPALTNSAGLNQNTLSAWMEAAGQFWLQTGAKLFSCGY